MSVGSNDVLPFGEADCRLAQPAASTKGRSRLIWMAPASIKRRAVAAPMSSTVMA
jgi:hypothetical protein